MREQFIVIDYSDRSDPEFLDDVDLIETKLGLDTVTFHDLPVPLTTVDTHKGDFSTAIDTARLSGLESDTEIKNQKRTILAADVRKNGRYLEELCDGDMAKKLRTGYRLSDEYSPVGELDAPDFIKAKAENVGELDVEIATVDKAYGYLYAFTPADNEETNPYNWRIRFSSKRKMTLRDLDPVTKYKLAGAAVGTSEVIHFCQFITRTVQG